MIGDVSRAEHIYIVCGQRFLRRSRESGAIRFRLHLADRVVARRRVYCFGKGSKGRKDVK